MMKPGGVGWGKTKEEEVEGGEGDEEEACSNSAWREGGEQEAIRADAHTHAHVSTQSNPAASGMHV
jgi:hypothetical protein